MSRYRPSDNVIAALIKQESGGNNNAVSPVGARGLAQVMPATGRDPGYGIKPLQDNSPEEQRRFAKDYLGEMVDRTGSLELGLAAYNSGLANVQKARGIPKFKETQNYVKNITKTINEGDDTDLSQWEEKGAAPNQDAGVDLSQWEEKPAEQSDAVEIGPINRFMQGVGGSVIKAGGALAEAVGADDISKTMLAESARAEKAASGFAGGAGKFIGSAVPYAIMPESIPLQIAASGAIAGLTTPGDIKERIKSAALSGGLTGVLGGAATAIRGFKPSYDASQMIKEGIQPTVGQGINQAGVLGRTLRRGEEAAMSVPLVGTAVRGARERAGGEWAKNIVTKAEIPTLGVSAEGKTGHEAIKALKKTTSQAYNNALKDVPIDSSIAIYSSADDFINSSPLLLSNDIKDSVKTIVSRELANLPENVNGDQLKRVVSTLRGKASNYRSSASASEREQGQLIQDAAQHIDDYMVSKLPQENALAYKTLDANYGKIKTIERAASTLGAQDGEFTGRQLLNAVRALDKSKDKSAFAQGGARLQDEAKAATKVLGSTVNDSGTAERAMIGGLLSGSATTLNPALLSVIPGAMAGATRPVQKALLGGYDKQQITSDMLRKITPAFAGATNQQLR